MTEECAMLVAKKGGDKNDSGLAAKLKQMFQDLYKAGLFKVKRQ